MTPLPITVTRAGLARITAAQLGAPVDFKVAAVALSDAPFVPAPTLEVVPGEFRRLGTVSGAKVGDNITHMVVRDNEAISYGVRGFGIILADGTLFAVYAQNDRLVEKSAVASLNLAIDLAFTNGVIADLTFGDANFLNPPATTDTKGVVEIATDPEADAGTDGILAVTARQLRRLELRVLAAVDALLAGASQALDGLAARTTYGSGLVKGGGRNDTNRTLTVDAASGAEIRAGTALDRAITPSALKDAGVPYIVRSELVAQGGYREWSDGLKECWGFIGVPANSTVTVQLPIAHTAYAAPAGAAGAIAQDEQMLGILNVTAAGFDVRSRNPIPATYYWHTKGV